MEPSANPTSSGPENEWPTLLCDNSRSGGQGAVSVRRPTRVRWQIRMGKSIRSAPVLRNGILYVTSLGGNLHAIDVKRGRQIWQFRAADQIHSTPSLYGNNVLFGCDAGKVYSVDGNSGKLLWETIAADEVWSSPVIHGGVVYFGSADGNIYAVDAESGKPRWVRELGAASTQLHSLPNNRFMSGAVTARSTRSNPRQARFCGVRKPVMVSTLLRQ